jgi:E3 ubiquitin-protein ligase DOA10
MGTMSFIHIKCLTEWINFKREPRIMQTTSSFQWTILECELCKTKFPDSVTANNGKKYKIFEYDEPDD